MTLYSGNLLGDNNRSESGNMTGNIHIVTDEERVEVQQCLLHMLKDIDYVCQQHDITYMLGGGTALGAVRHQGFIPWDDDLDLNMPREDYEKFLVVMQEELGEYYDFSYPNSAHVDYPFLKIFKKDTKFVELFDNMEYNAVWIDVFPIDYAPNNIILRQIKGWVSKVLFQGIGASLLIKQNNNPATKEMYRSSLQRKLRYWFALFIGMLFFFVSYKKVFNLFDDFVQSAVVTNIMTVPTGRKHYLGECLPVDIIYPVKKIKFCDMEAPVYHDVKAYLTMLYGNYMQIPPVEKREKHMVAEFSIDKENIRWKTN